MWIAEGYPPDPSFPHVNSRDRRRVFQASSAIYRASIDLKVHPLQFWFERLQWNVLDLIAQSCTGNGSLRKSALPSIVAIPVSKMIISAWIVER